MSKIPKRGHEVFMRKGKRTFASRKRKIAGLCAFVLAGVIGVGAYAFTASNTVAPSSAGVGNETISPYVVEPLSVKYTFTGTEPLEITGVEFKLETAASSVEAAVTAGAPAVTDYSAPCSGGTVAKEEIKCTLPAATTVLAATKLSVLAISGGTLPTP